MAIIKLKIRESKEGFQVDLTAKQLDIETEGFLPPLPSQLESSFNNWQLAYRQIDAVRSVFTSRQVRLTPKSVIKYSSAEYTNSVKESLNQWLNCGNSAWLPVRDKLISIAQNFNYTNEEVRIIIDAKDVNLRRLPWQEWRVFEEYYPQVEIALSNKNTNQITNYTLPQSQKIRVLVAVGRSDGINTKNDLEVIKELEQHDAEVICLMQPNRKELCNALWDEQGYHIFIFTGHSGSKEDGQIGWIELNDEDNLSIEEFKEALKQAIDKGLQLAIFNSCDGLGLANQLAQLHIPRCIVMREPVPDRVAVEFLKYFFKEFTCNQSLSKALNRARKRLEHFNLDYPGAIWLPTICIAPNVKSLTWKSLNSAKENNTEVNQKQNTKSFKPLILAGLIGFIGLITIGGVFALINSLNPESLNIETAVDEKSTFSSVNTPSGIFRYEGSTTWEPLRKILEVEIRRNHPNFQLNHQGAVGSEAGIDTLRNDRLVNGNLDFVLSSRHLKESEIQSKTGDFKLKHKPVAIDGIAIAVNHKLKIPGLTVKNLKDIYTGKVTNWKELGGPSLPIVAYSRNPDRGGTPEFFRKKVLHTQEFGQSIKFVNTTTEGLQEIEKTPGGIYYASAPEVVPQCSIRTLPIGEIPTSYVSLYKKPYVSAQRCKEKKQRNDFNEVNIQELKKNYPSDLTRKIYVVYKYTDSTNIEPDLIQESKSMKAGIAYANLLMTYEGKQLVKKAGFVPIN